MEFRNLLLPGLSRKEQAEAASWEILQQIEYPPGTFALGVEAGPETGEDILAAAVPLALLETGETIARQMDWELLRQEAAPAAWGRWMEQEPAAFLLVRDLDRIQGAWYGYGRLLALRNLPLADGEEAMPEETAGLLWDKLPAGIRERFQTGLTGLYLAGGTEEEQQAWKEFFQQQWDCPVRLLEGKAQFQWAPYYTEKQPSGLTSGLCGALGAVLSEGRPSAFCFASGGERGRWLSGISWLDLGKKMAAGTLALLLWGLGGPVPVPAGRNPLPGTSPAGGWLGKPLDGAAGEAEAPGPAGKGNQGTDETAGILGKIPDTAGEPGALRLLADPGGAAERGADPGPGRPEPETGRSAGPGQPSSEAAGTGAGEAGTDGTGRTGIGFYRLFPCGSG